MNFPLSRAPVLLAASAFLLSACNPAGDPKSEASPVMALAVRNEQANGAKGDEEHAHEHGAEGEGATFEAGQGVLLTDATRTALKLETVEVASAQVPAELLVSAHVYRAAREASLPSGRARQGIAYASAMIPASAASALQEGLAVIGQPSGEGATAMPGTISRFDRQLLPTSGQVELIVELPDRQHRLQVGDFIPLKITMPGAARSVLSVPSAAILRSTQGTFVFAQNGRYLLRTPVVLGAINGASVEVKDGLYEGDVVAGQAVETLWLIELRATKGGGHSHG